jgi:hypothetical protein
VKSKFLAIHTLALGLVFGAAPATEGLGQSVKPNIKHDVGGSCVYDRTGRVVFAPPGVNCADRTDHLSPAPAEASASLIEGLPEAMRVRVSELFRDHAHIHDELAQLRKAFDAGDQKLALRTLDKLTSEVVEHRVREERLFQEMASGPASR